MATRSEQEAIAFKITGAFEGRGYAQTTGNFDGAGWSIGFLQWNFGQGTLQRLLLAMEQQGPQTFRRCLGEDVAKEVLEVCSLPKEKAVAWADARSTGQGKRRVSEPYGVRLAALLAEPGFQAVQRHFAAPYMADARKDAAHYGTNTLRALCLFFDIAVQNGQGKAGANGQKAVDEVFRAKGGMALPYLKRLEAIAYAVADTANPRWRADVLSRKMAIVNGAGRVHGRDFHLDRDSKLSDEVLA